MDEMKVSSLMLQFAVDMEYMGVQWEPWANQPAYFAGAMKDYAEAQQAYQNAQMYATQNTLMERANAGSPSQDAG